MWVIITRLGAQIWNMQQCCACLMTDCEYDTFCHLCDGREIHIQLKVRASRIKIHPHAVIFLCGGFVISFYIVPSISTWLLTSSYFTFSAGKTAVRFTNQPQAAQPRRLTRSFKTNPFNRIYFFFLTVTSLETDRADQLTVHSIWLRVTVCANMSLSPSLLSSLCSVLSTVLLCLFPSLFQCWLLYTCGIGNRLFFT